MFISNKVKCPFCNSNLSKVIDKRGVLSRSEIRRRRECLKCAKRYTTYEFIAGLKTVVIKKDGRREDYCSDKLRAGLLKALEKRPEVEKVEDILARIEGKVRSRNLKEIPSQKLGRWVLGELKKIDGVAYLRFASVYRHFENPGDFEKELRGLGKI